MMLPVLYALQLGYELYFILYTYMRLYIISELSDMLSKVLSCPSP